MSKYNIDKATGVSQGINQTPTPKKSQYLTAFLARLGASVVVAIAMTAIGIWLTSKSYLEMEEVPAFMFLIGLLLEGPVIYKFVPKKSIGGAILGAILCLATYFIFLSFMDTCYYVYEYVDVEDIGFFFGLIPCFIIYSVYITYRLGFYYID